VDRGVGLCGVRFGDEEDGCKVGNAGVGEGELVERIGWETEFDGVALILINHKSVEYGS